MNNRAAIDTPDDACNWDRLTVREPASLPLYYTDVDDNGDRVPYLEYQLVTKDILTVRDPDDEDLITGYFVQQMDNKRLSTHTTRRIKE